MQQSSSSRTSRYLVPRLRLPRLQGRSRHAAVHQHNLMLLHPVHMQRWLSKQHSTYTQARRQHTYLQEPPGGTGYCWPVHGRTRLPPPSQRHHGKHTQGGRVELRTKAGGTKKQTPAAELSLNDERPLWAKQPDDAAGSHVKKTHAAKHVSARNSCPRNRQAGSQQPAAVHLLPQT